MGPEEIALPSRRSDADAADGGVRLEFEIHFAA